MANEISSPATADVPRAGENVTVAGLNAYLSRPREASTGGMLLLPSITGISPQLREFADGLAAAGVTALSWDIWRGRPGSDDPSQMETQFQWASELDDESSLTEMGQLLDHMFGELGCRRVGVIGWCIGGRFALLLGGRDSRMANVVAYHPTVRDTPAPNHTLDATEFTARIAAPTMILYPGADEVVSVESFRRLQAALNSRTTGPSIAHVYPGAGHGFTARAQHGNPINKAATDLSWPQALAFIRATTLV
ncbi:dienelactone hydrolase [Streptomyces sp. HC44]|uniref:Dienelactone hydrolase n=1 Tax=Streptomyces scabichelini TaxID=2711217 RepID=A0A6G4V784_9ACTN|nr:dienelactone hydrolase family protein [Streptomyces scabichelini]NGO09919.1 dienelactone hydrolase [Streptomyces scabichelini]